MMVETPRGPARVHLRRRRLDRLDEARAAYVRALELAHSDAKRRFLERRLAELRESRTC